MERMKKSDSNTEAFIEKSKPFLREWFLNCLNSSDCDENAKLRLSGIGINLPLANYICIVIDFDKNKIIDIQQQFTIYSKIEDAIKNSKLFILSFFDAFTFFYVLAVETDKEKSLKDEAFKAAKHFKTLIDEHNCLHYSIGIGRPAFKSKDIVSSYQMAKEASKYRYSLGNGQIFNIDDFEPKAHKYDHLKYQDEYITSIKVGNEDMMKSVVDQIFKKVTENDEPLDVAKRICLELTISTARAIYESGKNPSMLFEKTDVWTAINRCKTVNQLYNLILNTNKVVIFQLYSEKMSKNKNIIEKAKKLIDENPEKKAPLEWVAEKLFISPSYLSSLFSKETGITFKDYLIKSRISYAKGLLLNNRYKIYQVAKMVGYSDARYFSSLFYKHEGITPTEYRKINFFLSK